MKNKNKIFGVMRIQASNLIISSYCHILNFYYFIFGGGECYIFDQQGKHWVIWGRQKFYFSLSRSNKGKRILFFDFLSSLLRNQKDFSFLYVLNSYLLKTK